MSAHNPFLRHARHNCRDAGIFCLLQRSFTPAAAARTRRVHGQEFGYGPDGTLRDIEVGEELTLDYSFHGNPIHVWYRETCSKFVVLTEREIAERY